MVAGPRKMLPRRGGDEEDAALSSLRDGVFVWRRGPATAVGPLCAQKAYRICRRLCFPPRVGGAETCTRRQPNPHGGETTTADSPPAKLLGGSWMRRGRPNTLGGMFVSDLERRYTRHTVEIRAADDTQRRTIGGYAAKFNRSSSDLGGFVERIAPGFFARSAAEGWPGVMARYNHSDDFLLGTTDAGTLRLSIDDVGLVYEVDLPQHRADVYELVQRGDVTQSSFAFVAIEDDWDLDEDGCPRRTLVSGKLIDVAPVNTPAYPDTSTGLRSLAQKIGADEVEVRRLAAAGELRKVLECSATVVDLGSVLLRRMRLELEHIRARTANQAMRTDGC